MNNKILANIPWVVSVLAILAAGIVCSHITPDQTFAAIKGTTPYPWYFWVVSCSLLAIPLIAFACSQEFAEGTWEEKLLWLAITSLAISTVHQPRLFIDVQIFLFVACVLYIIFHRPFTFNRPRVVEWIVVAYLIWNVISLSWSNCPRFGGKLLNNMVPLLAYPLCFSFFDLKKNVLNRILLAFWQAVLIALTMSLISSFYEIRFLDLPITDLLTEHKHFFMKADYSVAYYPYQMAFAWSGADHPSYNAIWIISALICSFYLLKEKMLSAMNGIIGGILTLLTTLIIQSRVGIVMSIVVIAMGIYYISQHKIICLVGLGLALIAAAILSYLYPVFWQEFLHDPVRVTLFKIDYQYLTLNPWWGTGIGGMTAEHMSAAIPDFPYAQYEHWYPHNQLLGDWIQTGIVGMILSLALYIITLTYSIQQKRFMAIAFVLCMGLLACIEMPFYLITGVTLISLYGCLFLARLRQ